MPFLLLLGGARAGKSSLAQEIALRSGAAVTVVATAEPRDAEMANRIASHQDSRPESWATVEEPVELPRAVRDAPDSGFLLVDCLTLWVSNLIEADVPPAAILARAGEVAAALCSRTGGAVVVSNEVGLGIVPDNELARVFRDAVGSVNAAFAALADRTGLVVAGRVHELAAATSFMEGIEWLTPPRSST
jgi:adenosylcobinamide kinase / adenosylcobinamide-phosphate guanylyltransferase